MGNGTATEPVRIRASLTDHKQIRLMRVMTNLVRAKHTQLDELTKLPATSVTRHLSQLIDAGMLELTRGYYKITDAGVHAVVATADITPILPVAAVEAGFTEHYGHRAMPLGEDGETVAILGHLDRIHAIAVARRVIRVDTDGEVTRITDVRHAHGRFHEWWSAADDFGWFLRCNDTPAEGSIPVTVVEVEAQAR